MGIFSRISKIIGGIRGKGAGGGHGKMALPGGRAGRHAQTVRATIPTATVIESLPSLTRPDDELGDASDFQQAFEPTSDRDAFLHWHKVYTGFSSSNVTSLQYYEEDESLFVTFHDGSIYQYWNVSLKEAESFYDVPSKGGAVWDILRLRGTIHGHKKPYAQLTFAGSGPGARVQPMATHKQILEGRKRAEKRRKDDEKRAERGGYGPNWPGPQGPFTNPMPTD